MAAWKMCNRGHWYRNEPRCPSCTDLNHAEGAEGRPRPDAPRTLPRLQIAGHS